MNGPAKRAIVVGMDGASMEIVKNLADQGHCPNIAALMKQGAWRPMIGVFPTLTPPGWTALARRRKRRAASRSASARVRA